MWDFYLTKLASHPDYDKKESFYCGDAAGRKGPPKDFTDTDLKFGLNIGIKFYTPDQLFLEKDEEIGADFFNPKTLPTTGSLFKEKNFDIKSNVQESKLILVVFHFDFLINLLFFLLQSDHSNGKSWSWKIYIC